VPCLRVGRHIHFTRQGGSSRNDVLANSSTLVHGSQVTRLSHAGHVSFTRSPRGRSKIVPKACAVITVGGARQTVKLG
jgi:hypothetical protein